MTPDQLTLDPHPNPPPDDDGTFEAFMRLMQNAALNPQIRRHHDSPTDPRTRTRTARRPQTAKMETPQ